MHSRIQTGQTGFDFIPPTDDLPPTTTEETPIGDAIIDPLSQGGHHEASAVPVSGTPLPDRDVLAVCISQTQTYLQTVGVSVLATAHLSGLAAPVHMTDTGCLYGYVDKSLLVDMLHQAADTELSEDVVESTLLAHSMRFNTDMQSFGIDPDAAAQWSVTDGDNTTDRTPVVFTVPHPLDTLDTHTMLPERAVGLVAGIQNLTLDIDGVYDQRDVALLYLQSQLQASGLTDVQAVSELHAWYGVPRDVITSVVETVSDELRGGMPVENAEYRYFISSEVLEILSEK